MSIIDEFQKIFGDSKTYVTGSQRKPWGGTGNLDAINTGVGAELLKPWTTYQEDWVQDMNYRQEAGLDELYDYSKKGGAGRKVAKSYSDYGTDLAAGLTDSNKFYGDVMSGDKTLNEGPDMDMVAAMADNPYMNGMIDAASRDISRNLYENQMPGIAASAAGSGNLGSSRRGAAEAIASRGAADRIGDISSDLRGSAYEKALGLEATRSESNAGRQMDAAGSRAKMGELGIDLIGMGDDRMRQAFGDMVGVGNTYQAQEQAEIDAKRDQHDLDQRIDEEQLAGALDMTFEQEKAFGKLLETKTETEQQNLWDFIKDILEK